MKRVYLSGPVTKGNRSHNFSQSLDAQQLLMEAGYAVFNPMLTMMHPNEQNISWEMWLAGDLAWIDVCDLIVRLPGESLGADTETAHGILRGIPVLTLQEALECAV